MRILSNRIFGLISIESEEIQEKDIIEEKV
jgi:hypothetical protein